ncbi:MAG TPA: S41 family peptidase [Bryobacteraceae bacterium]
MPSDFTADLNVATDICDGKVLIESINRLALPASQFPFQVGDELVSVDGKSSDDWISEFNRFRKWGNPGTTRRYSADLITFRPQAIHPRAVELGASATVLIRRANGDLETYTLPWTKAGTPVTQIGPVPSPHAIRAGAKTQADDTMPNYMKPLMELQNWRAPETYRSSKARLTTMRVATWFLDVIFSASAHAHPFSPFPPPSCSVSAGIPAISTIREHMSPGGYKIGYIRVPNFSPNQTVALREIDAEIAYMRQNTDGLVIDVMRNPGGGCYMLNLASYLIPHNFYFFGEYVRPTLDRIESLAQALAQARAQGAPQWIIDLYTAYLQALKQAYSENRGLTWSLPACSLTFDNSPATDSSGNIRAYAKPLIVLVDEFSISAADIFPA